MLQDLLDGLVSLGDLVVSAVQHRDVEAEVVVLTHSLEVGMARF